MEEALVERLAAPEQRHLEVVADFLGSLPLGRPGDAADLLAMGVGGPHVVDARELLDDRAVHHLARPHQVEADALLGDELPDRQRERDGTTPAIASATQGCFERAAVRAKRPGQEGRDEIEEADPEEPDEPIRSCG